MENFISVINSNFKLNIFNYSQHFIKKINIKNKVDGNWQMFLLSRVKSNLTFDNNYTSRYFDFNLEISTFIFKLEPFLFRVPNPLPYVRDL